jgi:hypothetical protein
VAPVRPELKIFMLVLTITVLICSIPNLYDIYGRWAR